MQASTDSSLAPRPLPDLLSADVQRIQAELIALGGGTDPFAAAVQATRMPMLITNPREPDNPIIFVNDAFCRLTDYSRAEILGRNCRFLQGAKTDPDTVDRMRTAIKAGVSIEIDIQNHRKSGATFWNRLLLAPVHDAHGTLIYFFASQFDVTVEHDRLAFLESQNELLERKVNERTRELLESNTKLLAEAAGRQRVEEALRQSQKMDAIGQLTGGIAHDFNNMLQGVASGIELAKRRIASGEAQKAQDFLDAARDAARRAAELTRRLLAFGRKQALSPKPVILDNLVQGLASLIQQTVGPSIVVDLKLQDGCWAVRCDPNQLENALLNLAINARDAMLPAGGRLLIETVHTILDVADTSGWDEAQPRGVRADHRRRHGGRHGARRAGPCVRAVLHHQARRTRHRARPQPDLRLHAPIGRGSCGWRAISGRGPARTCICHAIRARRLRARTLPEGRSWPQPAWKRGARCCWWRTNPPSGTCRPGRCGRSATRCSRRRTAMRA